MPCGVGAKQYSWADPRILHGVYDVLFCETVAVSMNPGVEGLIYFNRRYHRLAAG
jgi:hypothetical protein